LYCAENTCQRRCAEAGHRRIPRRRPPCGAHRRNFRSHQADDLRLGKLLVRALPPLSSLGASDLTATGTKLVWSSPSGLGQITRSLPRWHSKSWWSSSVAIISCISKYLAPLPSLSPLAASPRVRGSSDAAPASQLRAP
jgi:hypothetical protein